MTFKPSSTNGFTLIEVMITVAIIGILAAIAYPGYREYVLHADRSEGLTLLNDAAARQERFYAQNNTYATTTAQLGYNSAASTNNLYSLVISDASASAYTLTATVTGTDSNCGDLSLNQAGTKGETGSESTAYCWQ
jgi:type IV pilus assembly protein PilE